MSFRPMFQQRAVAPIAATLLAGGVALYPRRTAYAEESLDNKKPIYDDFPADIPEPTRAPIELPPTRRQTPPSSSSPTPSDILTAQVRQARLFLYNHSLAAENSFNDFLSRALHIENAFTNTVASLAPSPESGERLLPGGVYVVVAAMAGSIVSRNRGIFLRSLSPLAFGTVAAWTLLPVTMRNVSDLVWEYEKKVPVVAEQHLALRERAEYLWHTGVAHSGMARQMMEEKIGETRKKLEELVSKGH
ncbi:MICOS complex subunit MIC26/MIC27 [Aspergillus fischeri NRRL 181]|uniref:MICOS complex subunit n=1 Tax=Neosartorya fischeri (strain ATCC 1020 / DSM 3700 / CBS 544.65 / FGSC A1164 / JCM 1740 / NRRL 181 / WB 181) TaxID=331117 RepID=A1DMR1_NEOFI|nr:mitochondrial protein, putative [Aspergillus fischeri NRRL 181]EAW16082.1 mitochondrial protein, putative [Aspergillus fischeri NRRL 181]